MITEIEIENFRCFEHTKIEGFARVNLIGGKNNSGKTALLEAILLNQSPKVLTIFFLRQLRQESDDFSKAYPEKTWDNFYYCQDKAKKPRIVSHNEEKTSRVLEIITEEKIKSVDKITNSRYLNSPNDLNLIEHPILSSFLDLSLSFDKKTSTVCRLESDSVGIISTAQDRYDIIPEAIFIPSNLRLTTRRLAEEYDILDSKNESDKILSKLQILDPSIEVIKTWNIGEANIYLKRKNERFLPLSLFGDAIKRVIEIMLILTTNEVKTLLVDEIENGIHYTNHREFWKALFELAKQLDVQIFATTHSLEMIQAFRDIGLLEDYKEEGAYFEMARNPRSDKIVGIKHNLELLDYELKRNEGVRGE